MTYYATTEMANSQALRDRIVSAAAMEGEPNPFTWVTDNIWRIVSHSDWVAAWDSAEENKTKNVNPDTGERDDVITDGMILAAVQSARTT